MLIWLFTLAVLLALSLAATIRAEVRRQRNAREADDIIEAFRDYTMELERRVNSAYQYGHVAGVVDAARNIMADPAWRVVVSAGGKTLKASMPMPYAAALIVAGRTMGGVGDGVTVEVERT